MALPIWDSIDIPPDYTLVDINGLADEDLRLQMQGEIFDLWKSETSGEPRPWDDNEGAFVVYDSEGAIVGVTILWDVADA